MKFIAKLSHSTLSLRYLYLFEHLGKLHQWDSSDHNHQSRYPQKGDMASNTTELSHLVPTVTQRVTSKDTKVSFGVVSQCDTVRTGNLLGIMRPLWIKVCESEQRIAWLTKMIGKRLVVRNLEAFAKAIGEQLRSEEYKFKEEERHVK